MGLWARIFEEERAVRNVHWQRGTYRNVECVKAKVEDMLSGCSGLYEWSRFGASWPVLPPPAAAGLRCRTPPAGAGELFIRADDRWS